MGLLSDVTSGAEVTHNGAVDHPEDRNDVGSHDKKVCLFFSLISRFFVQMITGSCEIFMKKVSGSYGLLNCEQS